MYRDSVCFQYFAITDSDVISNIVSMYILLLEIHILGKFLDVGFLGQK